MGITTQFCSHHFPVSCVYSLGKASVTLGQKHFCIISKSLWSECPWKDLPGLGIEPYLRDPKPHIAYFHSLLFAPLRQNHELKLVIFAFLYHSTTCAS